MSSISATRGHIGRKCDKVREISALIHEYVIPDGVMNEAYDATLWIAVNDGLVRLRQQLLLRCNQVYDQIVRVENMIDEIIDPEEKKRETKNLSDANDRVGVDKIGDIQERALTHVTGLIARMALRQAEAVHSVLLDEEEREEEESNLKDVASGKRTAYRSHEIAPCVPTKLVTRVRSEGENPRMDYEPVWKGGKYDEQKKARDEGKRRRNDIEIDDDIGDEFIVHGRSPLMNDDGTLEDLQSEDEDNSMEEELDNGSEETEEHRQEDFDNYSYPISPNFHSHISTPIHVVSNRVDPIGQSQVTGDEDHERRPNGDVNERTDNRSNDRSNGRSNARPNGRSNGRADDRDEPRAFVRRVVNRNDAVYKEPFVLTREEHERLIELERERLDNLVLRNKPTQRERAPEYDNHNMQRAARQVTQSNRQERTDNAVDIGNRETGIFRNTPRQFSRVNNAREQATRNIPSLPAPATPGRCTNGDSRRNAHSNGTNRNTYDPDMSITSEMQRTIHQQFRSVTNAQRTSTGQQVRAHATTNMATTTTHPATAIHPAHTNYPAVVNYHTGTHHPLATNYHTATNYQIQQMPMQNGGISYPVNNTISSHQAPNYVPTSGSTQHNTSANVGTTISTVVPTIVPTATTGSTNASSTGTTSASNATASGTSSVTTSNGTPQGLDALTQFMDNRSRTPHLPLTVFDGKMENWKKWWAIYSFTIHNNKTMSDSEKIMHLFTNVSGEAQLAIEYFDADPIYYDKCIDVLQKRYNQGGTTRQKMYERVKSIPVSSNAIADIRSTFVKVDSGVKCLNVLEDNEHSTIMMDLIKTKFPEKYQTRLGRWVHEAGDNWTISSIMEKLNNHIVAEEAGITSKPTSTATAVLTTTATAAAFQTQTPYVDRRSRTPTRHFSHGSRYDRSFSRGSEGRFFTTNEPKPVIKNGDCGLCLKTGHHAVNCKQITDVHERRTAARKNGLCFRCLSANHVAKECTAAGCGKCPREHHVSLCYGDREPSLHRNPSLHRYESGGRNDRSARGYYQEDRSRTRDYSKSTAPFLEAKKTPAAT